MRYFIRLAYNGAPFCGWQIQPNGTSVQGELERAFSLILNEEIGITGCGRTDAGVNARQIYDLRYFYVLVAVIDDGYIKMLK